MGPIGTRYQHRRTTHAPLRQSHRDRESSDELHCAHDIEDGVTNAISQVANDTWTSRYQVVQGGTVTRCEVPDVHIVPNCRAVRRRVVGAKDLEFAFLGESRPKYKWNQMGLWRMTLSKDPF